MSLLMIDIGPALDLGYSMISTQIDFSGHDKNYVRDRTIFSLHYDADCQIRALS